MLKRLELVGFKSFADKTAFEFPPGISAVVGPNGSGKSNVVDAVKWVLGEQSAKSLRGGEMADVIFNGSTSRKSLGMAEVSLLFDNARRSLNSEAAEVLITRRVYRDGEGEYLVNGQQSRLKDIKDLFLGSGAGTGAYSIIEQGRVDALLQASTVDRRTIFEEAAGISRFKAKKVESLRRLERVAGNLTRLRDILAEVENQLRGVRLQASKAQRYQEYSTRLRDLRVALGLREYRELADRLTAVESVLSGLREELTAAAERSEAGAGDARRLEAELAELESTVRSLESAIAAARTARAAAESTLGHERSLSAGLADEAVTGRARLADATGRIATLTAARAGAEAEWQDVERRSGEQRAGVKALADALKASAAELGRLHAQIETDKVEHMERLREAARLQNDAVSDRALLDQLRRERDRLSAKNAQASEHLATLDLELASLTEADAELQTRLTEARFALQERGRERDANRAQVDAMRGRLGELRAQGRGLASRIEVLEGLERSREGFGSGIREVLEALGDPAHALQRAGLGECVVGLVGDLLSAPREYAHLLDIALGPVAQCFVARDLPRLTALLAEQPPSGRVGFVPLAAEPPPAGPEPAGSMRADTLAVCDYPALPGQLLGRTRIVADLATARALAAELPDCRFVTLKGELLEADGTLTLGTHHAEAGLLSRKSELRELRQKAADLDEQAAATERELEWLVERGESIDGVIRATQREIDAHGEQAADLRGRIAQHRERRDGLHEEVTLSRTELSGLGEEVERVEGRYRGAKAKAEAAERDAHEVQTRLADAERDARAKEQERTQGQHAHAAAQVALAQIDERLTGLRARHEQLVGDLHERHRERDELADRLAATLARLAASERTQLDASMQLAEACSAQERDEAALAGAAADRDARRAELRALTEQAQAALGEWQSRQQQVHARELEASDLRHRRDALVARLREDYEIDLVAESEALPPSPGFAGEGMGVRVRDLESQISDRADTLTPIPSPAKPGEGSLNVADAQAEIDDLRKKLARLGSVNLDSLQELADLELRHDALKVQLDDLAAAEKSLTDIIARINADSRKLFAETFALIRTNFQDLFRKLFGGGQADVVLENEEDVLESGIEVVARPPGKELRSISLMSGGEKTLTAVALLLAIFRSKPSPFCILDEVDAALDEGNTVRLSNVLREFLTQSQFIIVTHSKRTMASADVLYGVTMQESGVSKRVAVRFEDWPDDERRAA